MWISVDRITLAIHVKIIRVIVLMIQVFGEAIQLRRLYLTNVRCS